MGNVYMEAEQVRFKNSTYHNLQTAVAAALEGGGGGGTTVVANPEGAATADLAKLQVGETIYGIPADASDISYDNTSSGMTADDVQDAIDELSTGLGGVTELIPSGATTSNKLATASDIPDAVTGNPSGSATAGNLTKIQIGDDIYTVPGGSGNSNEYSLNEVLIGTYLGANLYRKCFDVGALTGGQTKEYTTDLTGVTVRNYAGYVTRTTDGNLFKCPYVWDTNSQNIGMGIDYHNGYVRCLMRPGSDYSNITGFMAIEYTKNT